MCTCIRHAELVQWWEHSSPINVAQVWFRLGVVVGWVCVWFSACLEDFPRVLWFSSFVFWKTNTSKFQFDQYRRTEKPHENELELMWRILHSGEKIWILCSSGKNIISRVSAAYSWDKRELKQTTTTTATRTSLNKRFNEQNNGCAHVFKIFVHFFAVLCKTITWNHQVLCRLKNVDDDG